ncbi:TetR/AcrR family transcriptional regulator [Actinomadura sp. 9N215]|uniref:TetR/AcrR family transcriptional regulator n=1 Tax=Actinomadura sp. 9N215 TaxID=3375150 RepID=UPI00378843AC
MPPGTRDQLIEMATRLLDEGGPEAVTLREVGRLAGVSHNAPYKHFTNKEALLSAIAARELTRSHTALKSAIAQGRPPADVLRTTLHHYIARALEYPARFKLTFGTWTTASEELHVAAHQAQTLLVDVVAASQRAGALPSGDPVRLASLLRALAHGAADLASAGHLAADGKGHADPGDLVDDLLHYLRKAAPNRPGG